MRLNDQIEEFLRIEEETNRRRTQCTASIARAVGVPTAVAREELYCMENAGIVKRYLPWCHRGMLWWERVDGSAKAPTTLATVKPPMADTEQRARDMEHARAACPNTAPGSLEGIKPPRYPKVVLAKEQMRCASHRHERVVRLDRTAKKAAE